MSIKNEMLGFVADRSFRPVSAKGHTGYKVFRSDVVGHTRGSMMKEWGDVSSTEKHSGVFLGEVPVVIAPVFYQKPVKKAKAWVNGRFIY